jgi:hypothetical protein
VLEATLTWHWCTIAARITVSNLSVRLEIQQNRDGVRELHCRIRRSSDGSRLTFPKLIEPAADRPLIVLWRVEDRSKSY